MTEVRRQTFEQHRRELDLPDDRVARTTKQAAHAPGRMAMIDDELTVACITQPASTILRLAQRFDIGRGQLVLPHQSGPQILGAGGVGILAAPLPEPLVTALPVGLPVLPVASADAVAALLTGQTPCRELGVGKIAATKPARRHAETLSRSTDMLDQPCHADVLLEIANGTTP